MTPADSEKPAPDPVPSVWTLKKKQKAGAELSAAERQVIREYEAKYRSSRVSIYVPPKELAEFEDLAAKKGMQFSPWIVNQVGLSLQDKTPREQELDAQLLKVVAERDNLRLQLGQLATENAEATRRERNHADALRRLVERIARLRDQKLGIEAGDEGAKA